MSRIPVGASLTATTDAPDRPAGAAGPGRPRDHSIDARVLSVTRAHLASVGYDAMSVAAIAKDAGTTRAALHRRWVDKADLATAAIAAMPDAAPPEPSGDPLEDLVRELSAFRRGVTRPDGLPMVGAMLMGSVEHGLVERYRERVVAPRRRRLRSILEGARSAGVIDADADLDIAVSMLTGSWYAAALAGDRPPVRWAERAATAVWRACGGAASPQARSGGAAQAR